MIKTVITVSDYGEINGGSAKVAIESAIALANAVEESILFCAVGKNFDSLKAKNVKVICLNQYDILNNPNRLKAIAQGIWNRKAKKEFKKLLLTKDPQKTIIHIHAWASAISSSIFKVAEKMGFKVVVTLHDYFLACPNGGFFNYKLNKICDLMPLSVHCVFCNCDKRCYWHKIWRVLRQLVQNKEIIKRNNLSYIFISEFSKVILSKYIKKANFYKVRNPIEIKERIKVDAEKNQAYLYIGRLTEEKGIRLFCEAVSQLQLKGIVVGDGYLLKELKEKYPLIEFVGWQNYDNVRKYIMKARCLIFPSVWYEGSPLTISEVQAFGIPCIVSDCCAGKENIIDNINGNVFKANDIKDLCDVIELYSNDIYVNKISNYIYNTIDISKRTYERYTGQLMKIYLEILKQV